MTKEKSTIFKKQFGLTRKLVNEWDPCSLIESDAPEDEYDTLTIKILSGIENEKTEVDIKKEIIDLLDNYYGSPIFNDLDEANQNKLKNDIDKLIKKIKKRTANKELS